MEKILNSDALTFLVSTVDGISEVHIVTYDPKIEGDEDSTKIQGQGSCPESAVLDLIDQMYGVILAFENGPK